MIKPYIKVTYSTQNKYEFTIIDATLYAPDKEPQSLDLDKACDILNKANKKFFIEGEENTFIIENDRIIKQFYSKQVSHEPLFWNTVLISSVLLLYLTKPTVDTVPNPDRVWHKDSPKEFTNTEQTKKLVKPATLEEIKAMTVFSFDSEDFSYSEKYNYVIENYWNSITKYANIYGLDPNLVAIIIMQENYSNMPNYGDSGSRGVTKIESIWWGKDLGAYNFETKSWETVTVDGNALNENIDYAIKIGCMILNSYYKEIYQTYYPSVLNEQECLLASITAYNFGTGATRTLIDEYGADWINHREDISNGDAKFLEHIFRYLTDDTIINMQNVDGTTTSICIQKNNGLNSIKKHHYKTRS